MGEYPTLRSHLSFLLPLPPAIQPAAAALSVRRGREGGCAAGRGCVGTFSLRPN